MPERLLSVISGILAGGIPGFRFELCCFSPSHLAPFCVSVFSLFCFFFGGHSHNDTQDVIMHVIPTAGSDPTSLCSVWFGLVVVVCFLVLFASFFVWFVFDGIAHWTVYWAIIRLSALLRLSTNRRPCLLIYNSSFLLRLNVCNDLAKAMKALDGKKP